MNPDRLAEISNVVNIFDHIHVNKEYNMKRNPLGLINPYTLTEWGYSYCRRHKNQKNWRRFDLSKSNRRRL